MQRFTNGYKYNTTLLQQTDEFGHNINIKYECLIESKVKWIIWSCGEVISDTRLHCQLYYSEDGF